MKPMHRRTLLAAVLAGIAVAVPCAAWFAVGSREITRELERSEHDRQNSIQNAVMRLAERLAERLETLRDNESQRPYYHYQNLYHDPQGASEGVSVIPSPLAQGPANPLVWSYFQVNPAGKLSLPTINDEIAERNAPGEQSAQLTIRKELQTIAGRLVSALPKNPSDQLPAQQEREAGGQQTGAPAMHQAPSQVQILEPGAYSQNVAANDIYLGIKNRKGQDIPGSLLAIPPLPQPKAIIIRVGPFQWRTVAIRAVPSLVSLREVFTPDGRLTQGFVISLEAVEDWLAGMETAGLPARFRPGTAQQAGEAGVPIEGAAWKIACDPSRVMAAAQNEASKTRTRFQRNFLAGMGAACLAAFGIVFIVWQTERLARQRSRFAASAAHELRTPLAGLRIYSEMLAEGLGEPAKTKDYARRIANEAERLGRVVANVLGFTQLERGALKVQPQLGNLAEAVRECVARQQPALEAAGAQIEFLCHEDLPPIRFDRDAVAEIVQNLLDNAEKHTRSAENRTILVSLEKTDGALTLSVRDHGAGIPAEMKRRLFRPFARIADADSPAGLGLGLVLVRALVRGHGGKVTYIDASDGGAKFTVLFPS
jgi:signal transduction histidine kinase